MTLRVLERRDQRAASGILAAAALASAANVAGDEPAILKTYGNEARELLSEIRDQLHIGSDDTSSSASALISNFLTKQIQATVLGDNDTLKILARAGQHGRIPSVLYSVEFPPKFLEMFVQGLGVHKNSVVDAVKHPDDYQHLMTEFAPEESKDVISLFVKEVKSARKGNDHWLLIHTIRAGLKQIAQSAWRIFPDVVDLTGAYEPLHLLKAFVNVFGLPVKIGDHSGLFIESEQHKRDAPINFAIEHAKETGFASISTSNSIEPNMIQVGVAYSIDIPKYRAFLVKRGAV